MVVQFSREGTFLATAICDDALFPIRLFQISGLGNVGLPPAARVCDLSGHANLVYDLCWSFEDRMLASASADASACVWDIQGGHTSPALVCTRVFTCFGRMQKCKRVLAGSDLCVCACMCVYVCECVCGCE